MRRPLHFNMGIDLSNAEVFTALIRSMLKSRSTAGDGRYSKLIAAVRVCLRSLLIIITFAAMGMKSAACCCYSFDKVVKENC